MRIANAGKEIPSCFHVSRDSHHSTTRGGRFWTGFINFRSVLLLLPVVVMLASACDPVTGTGSGTPPDPKQYLRVDPSTRTAILTLIAGYPTSQLQFNYNGYGSGALVLTVPIGWQITVQCENRGTVANSCAVVSGRDDSKPLQPGWSTPDPQRGLDPNQSASFVFSPSKVGSYRIASLVGGNEASGMWLDLEVVQGGQPMLTAPGS